MLSKWILAGSVAALSAGIALPLVRPTAAKANDVPGASTDIGRGKQLFTSMGCYQCHGYAGQGSQSTGPALVPLRRDTASFLQYLRSPSGAMPAFGVKILPDADARDIFNFVRSLSPGTPPEKIALLAPYVVRRSVPQGARPTLPAKASSASGKAIAEGGELFAAHCAMCHGSELQGGLGPALRSVGNRYSVDQIAAIITTPPPKMPKLTPQPLSPAQVVKVAAFLLEKR